MSISFRAAANRALLALFPVLLLVCGARAAEPDANVPPIKAITGVKPQASVFDAATRNKPLVIRTADEAAKHFDEEALAALKKQVDLTQQFVLVFAWRGSGQDRLTHAVLESFPEQIAFSFTPGRTRDLRPHVHIYALRSNVKWRVR